MFCWLVPWRYRMFQMLWLDYNHNRRVIGTRVVWSWQGSNPNNPNTHHLRFHILEENWKYQMPVRTEDFDKAIAEVIRTFDGVEEIWEGFVNFYLKERYIGGLNDLLWKITTVPVTVPGICSELKGDQYGNIKLLPCAKMLLVPINFFLQRVDYGWANIHQFCRLFYTERSWHAYWFSAVYFWSAWFAPWCESRAFSLTPFET